MPNDADRAQARMLASLLQHEITEISDELKQPRSVHVVSHICAATIAARNELSF
jgi:hypothetical protein